MRTIGWRAVAASCALVAGLVVSLVGVAAPGLAAGPPTASVIGQAESAAPIADLGSCVAGGGAGDVLLLVDESGSLTTSDPQFSRVASATFFVEQLARSAQAGGLDLNVQLSVFGHEYSTLLGWTKLSDATLPTMRSSIAGLADRVGGVDTDYWTALDGARRDLAAQALSRGEATSCQAVVWFTDGELDFYVRGSDGQEKSYGINKVFAPGIELTTPDGASRVRESAVADLCRDGGLADQVRSSGIRLYGVGLSASTSTPGDFGFFEALVAGTSGQGSTTCGALIDPAPGEFHLATDLDSLLFAFDSVSSPGADPIIQNSGICQVERCADQSHRFVLDASTPEVSILATADVSGLEVALELPSGEVVDLPSGTIGETATVGTDGMTIDVTWQSDRTVSVVLAQGTSDVARWAGLWQLTLTDPSGTSAGKTSRSNIHIAGSLRPAWLNSDEVVLQAGGIAEGLQFGLVDRQGTQAQATSILGTVNYAVTLEDSAGTRTMVLNTSDATMIGELTDLDLSAAAVGAGLLTLQMSITTAPVTLASGEVVEGTTLEPESVGLAVTIVAPPAFPILGSAINFGPVTGAADVVGTLSVNGAGCAWLAADTVPRIVASPQNIGQVSITSEGADSRSTCREAGGGSTLEMRLTSDDAGNGTLNGSIVVMIAAADGAGEPMEVEVPFTASLEKPLNASNFWIALLVALILGPGIPLLILYGAKRAVSKIPPRALVGTLIEVAVGHEVLRDGRPFALGPADLRNTVPVAARGSRRLSLAGVELKTRVGIAPGGAGYVEVAMPGRLGASSVTPARTRRGNARLPLAVHDKWVVLRTPGDPADRASVLVLVGADTSQAQRVQMESDINRRLPQLLKGLVDDAPPANGQASTARSPFGTAGTVPTSLVGSPFTGSAEGAWGGPPASTPPDSQGGTSPWGTPQQL